MSIQRKVLLLHVRKYSIKLSFCSLLFCIYVRRAWLTEYVSLHLHILIPCLLSLKKHPAIIHVLVRLYKPRSRKENLYIVSSLE